MATDKYSSWGEVELREEIRQRELKVPTRVSAMKPENRRAALRRLLREDDASKVQSKRRRWVPALVGALLVWALVVAIIWFLWPREGEEVLIPAPTQIARENSPPAWAGEILEGQEAILERVSALEVAMAPEPTAEPEEVVANSPEPEIVENSPEGASLLGEPVAVWMQGAWEVQEFDLDNDPLVKSWIQRLQNPDPANWRTYPNVPNPDIPSFDVGAGAEYGVPNVPFCQQDQRCDFVVPGWHYRLISARYTFLDMSCDEGCLLLLVNVMDKTMTWRDQMADNGFSVPGRYWDGDRLDQAVWGIVSYTSAAMLNMPTLAHPDEVLNAGDPANAGSNCGDVHGCDRVNATIVVTAGDRILAVLKTTVVRP